MNSAERTSHRYHLWSILDPIIQCQIPPNGFRTRLRWFTKPWNGIWQLQKVDMKHHESSKLHNKNYPSCKYTLVKVDGATPKRLRFVRGYDKPIYGSCAIHIPGGTGPAGIAKDLHRKSPGIYPGANFTSKPQAGPRGADIAHSSSCCPSCGGKYPVKTMGDKLMGDKLTESIKYRFQTSWKFQCMFTCPRSM